MKKEQILNFVLLMFLEGILIEWHVGMLCIARLEIPLLNAVEIAGVFLLLNAIAAAIAVGLTIHFKVKFEKIGKLQVADDAGQGYSVRRRKN